MTGGVDMLDAQAAGNDRAVTRSFSDIAVLCRTRKQLEQLEACLVHDSIPCVISGRDDYLEHPVVQGLLGFFASLLDPKDSPSLHAALSALWRVPDALCQRAAVALLNCRTEKALDAAKLKQETEGFELLLPWAEAVETLAARVAKEKPRKLIETLAELCGAQGRPVAQLLNTAVFASNMRTFLSTLLTGEEADVRRACGAYASGAVRLMTLHGAKGLEFPVVFLAGVTAGTLPLERAHSPADPAEERRLFFVGITRAREELILSCGGTPSAFLSELPPRVAHESARPRNRMPKTEQLRLF